ncbi:MAG: hypothetical protein IPK04_10575 [Bdellovibrionales bacterium]|nr:hypothetical protein [Bdellovibrionales bacterium]
MSQSTKNETKALISLIACGIGSLTLGILICAAEENGVVKSFLNFYNPVGPLAGKTTFAVVAYVVSWFILSQVYSQKTLDFGKAIKTTFVLIGLGIVLSFPPVFMMFGSH